MRPSAEEEDGLGLAVTGETLGSGVGDAVTGVTAGVLDGLGGDGHADITGLTGGGVGLVPARNIPVTPEVTSHRLAKAPSAWYLACRVLMSTP